MTADLVGAYGAGVLALPAETRYALWRDRRRVLMARAEATEAALRAAQSHRRLPALYFDAQADTAEEALREEYRVNSDRAEASLARRHR